MKLVKRVHYSLVTSGGQKYEEQLDSTSKNEVLCYDGPLYETSLCFRCGALNM